MPKFYLRFCFATCLLVSFDLRAQDCGSFLQSPKRTSKLREISKTTLENRLVRVIAALNQMVPAEDEGRYYKTSSFRPHTINPGIFVARVQTPEGGTLLLLNSGDIITNLSWGQHNLISNQRYVFDFSDAYLQVKDFNQVLLENLPASLPVIRNMGKREYGYWVSGNMSRLRNSGHYWGYESPVIHLEVGHRSWIGSHRRHAVKFDIPKVTLQRWILAEQASFGVTQISPNSPSGIHIELVVKNLVFDELAEHFTGTTEESIPLYQKATSALSFGILRLLGKHKITGQ